MTDFTNIEYLKSGNMRQKKAYQELKQLDIFDKLKAYNPILTGTIPIDIDIPDSDLDIICECANHSKFSSIVTRHFGHKNGFKITSSQWNGIKATIAKFRIDSFEIEIFGQNIRTEQQNAYKHMLIEYQVLNKMGKDFRISIRKLKQEGLKTEPAFAKLLGLTGNPYEELLKFEL